MIDEGEYSRRAEAHRPKTPAEVLQAARDLLRDGHTDHTISAILKIDVNAVRAMLGAPQEAAAACA